MNKLIISFLVLSLFCTVLDAMYGSGHSAAATRLTANVSDTATTLAVRDTGGFADVGYVEVGTEKVGYNGKTDASFTNLTRGYSGTTASYHSAGDAAYSPTIGAINSALGFSVVSTGSTAGVWDLMMFPVNFVTDTVPKVTTCEYNFLKEGDMQWLKIIMQCFAAGFVFSVAYLIMSAAGGVLQSIFVRR